jgi:microsomal dipeptidase-like Zn-dependent dipeptidase
MLFAAGCGGPEEAAPVEESASALTLVKSTIASKTVCTPKRWDFENGTLQGWTASGTAFISQPTYGNNISTSRVKKIDPSFTTKISKVGGDYWEVPASIGIQGKFWIGTYEDRPTIYNTWGRTRGDSLTGSLVSPSFSFDGLCHKYIHFLVGGGCSTSYAKIELQRWTGSTWQAVPGSARTGKCVGPYPDERLRRVVVAFSSLGPISSGTQLRLRIYDGSAYRHLNIDDINVTNAYPTDAGDKPPVWGMADVHAHPGAQAAFGGHLLHGHTNDLAADGTINNPYTCDGTAHYGVNGLSASKTIATLEDDNLYGKVDMLEAMSPWPTQHTKRGIYNSAWHSITHQKMYEKWIRRAYDGGLRLMVAEAVNNRMMDWAMSKAHPAYGPSQTDSQSVDAQINLMLQLISRNSSWMELAKSPSHARSIIEAGKLAVVLGVEVDSFANCDTSALPTAINVTNNSLLAGIATTYHAGTSGCTVDYVKRLDELYKQGVRQLHPVHLTDNGFGGAAVYSDLFNTANHYVNGYFFGVTPVGDPLDWRFEHTQNIAFNGVYTKAIFPINGVYSGYSGMRNTRGLDSSGRGKKLITEMMRRGMIIAADHMSERMLDQVIGIGQTAVVANPSCPWLDASHPTCWDKAYPVALTHFMPRDLQFTGAEVYFDTKGKLRSEIGKRADQIARIYKLGGVVAPGTGGADSRFHGDSTLTSVANTCAGSSRSFAQLYKYLWGMGADVSGMPVGTDTNGMNAGANPRYGVQGCWRRSKHVHGRYYQFPSWYSYDHSQNRVFPSTQNNLDGQVDYQQRIKQLSSKGVNYEHYGCSGSGCYLTHWTALGPSILKKDQSLQAMYPAYNQKPLKAAQTDGSASSRWDINFQGVAHYGMLPDLFQDLRAVGMKREHMGPLFSGAEAYIRMWEKACKLSDASVNSPGCS